jgi:hypothetical protein
MTRSRDVADTQDNSGGAVAPFVAGKNKIINGDFAINQRGFSSASNTAGFKFDRWDVSSFNSGTITDSSQTFTPGTAPVTGYEGSTYYRVVTNTGAGNGNYYFLRQKIEDVRTLANQTATISFWAKSGSGTPKIAVELTQAFGSGGSPSTAVNTYINQVTLSTSWTRYTLTTIVPSISGKTIGTTANTSSLQLNLWVTAGSDYNSRTGSLGIQENTFDIWGVQVEAGSVATPFTTATGTLQGELAACQRYYFRITSGEIYEPYTTGGVADTANTTIHYIQHPVTMRVKPTTLDYANLGSYDGVTLTGTPSSVTIVSNQSNANISKIGFTKTSSFTQYRPAFLIANNSASAYVGLSAEL